MSKLLFSNNAATTLGSAISAVTTTITVTSGTGSEFPSPTGGDYFSATLWAAGSTTGTPNEIVYVTARTGDTMTVMRGQEGTTAQAWNVGDTFANYPTAAFYNNAATDAGIQKQAGNFAADTGTANAGVATLTPVPTLASLLGAPIRVLKAASANTGAYTLNVNGLGVKPVTLNGFPLAAGQLPASQIFEVAWDGASFELLSVPAGLTTGRLIAVRTFTTSTVYTPTTGTASVEVTVVGAGGGGGGTGAMGGSQFGAGGGGGSGGWGLSYLATGFSGQTITIGLGGAGGTGANGSTGGTTSFGALLSASGGGGGAFGVPTAGGSCQVGGVGGSASGANLYSSGGAPGTPSVSFTNGNQVSGGGGGSAYGAGGSARNSPTNPGIVGAGPGGGGGGATGQSGAGAQTGGNGANGIVIIREFG